MAQQDTTSIDDPNANIRQFGVDNPTIATPEQNQRVAAIMQALMAGVSPASQGVEHAGGLSPVYSQAATQGQPVNLGETPFELSGYRRPGGDPGAPQQGAPGQPTPPNQQHQALLNALRTNPQQTIQALGQISQQMKGIPAPVQQELFQGLGLMEPKPAPITAESVQAAAAGQPVQGLSQQMAQQILERQRQYQVQVDLSKKEAEAEVKGRAPLHDKAKIYFNEYGDQAKPDMTFEEASKLGYMPRSNPQAIPAAKSVYFSTTQLRPLIDRLLPKVQKQEQNLPFWTRFSSIKKNQAAMQMLRQSGDPDVRQFDQYVQAGLARYLMALGIPGGRESVALLTRMGVEFPDSADSAESAKKVLNGVDDMIFMSTGIKKKPMGGQQGAQVPRVKQNNVYYVRMGNQWYVDPNQGD